MSPLHDAPAPSSPRPQDCPATDSQLLRLGRLLSLRHDEAEALLELLAAPPPCDRVRPARRGSLRALMRRLSPDLIQALYAVPGLFLLTDGVTAARLDRARARSAALLGAAARLERLLAWTDAAMAREAALLHRAARALSAALRSRRLDGREELRDLLRPLARSSMLPRRAAAQGELDHDE